MGGGGGVEGMMRRIEEEGRTFIEPKTLICLLTWHESVESRADLHAPDWQQRGQMKKVKQARVSSPTSISRATVNFALRAEIHNSLTNQGHVWSLLQKYAVPTHDLVSGSFAIARRLQWLRVAASNDRAAPQRRRRLSFEKPVSPKPESLFVSDLLD